MRTIDNLSKIIDIFINAKIALEEKSKALEDILNEDFVIILHQSGRLDNGAFLKEYLLDSAINGALSTSENYKKLCLLVLTIDGLALRYVEEVFDDQSFYLIAVKQNGLALEYVPKSLPFYIDICYAAIGENTESVQFVPKSLEAVAKKNLYLFTVGLDGLSLEYIFDAQNDVDVCTVAVDQNIFAMEFVDEEIRALMYHSEKRYEYLERNYMSHIYIPRRDKAYVTAFLEKISHVVVFNKNDLQDKEIEDVRLVYANIPSIKDKVTCVTTAEVRHLLNDIEAMPRPTEKIHLMILGHGNVTVEKIAGLSAEEVSQMIEEYPSIHKVTLFGCKTVQALKLEEEKQVIREVGRELAMQKSDPCALLITKSEDMSPPEKLLKASKLKKAFVISQQETEKGFRYVLKYIEKKESTVSVDLSLPLSNEEKVNLQNQFTKRQELSTVFGKNLTFCIIRSNVRPLEFAELEVLNSFFARDQFNPLSPLYQKSKRNYPFLRSMTITEEEAYKKITCSLLQKLIMAIKLNDKITREVIVKGYSNLLHVDKAENSFHVLPNMSYTYGYYSQRLFKQSIDNMDRKKLTIERKKLLEEMEHDIETGATLTKSIKVILRPKELSYYESQKQRI